jgi:hypothetical protein
MKRTGIQLDSTGEIIIANGALQIGDTLYQNQYLILKAQKGEIKEFPTLGCGIDDLANDEDIDAWQKLIREEFAKDGLRVDKLSITTSGMEVKADYK